MTSEVLFSNLYTVIFCFVLVYSLLSSDHNQNMEPFNHPPKFLYSAALYSNSSPPPLVSTALFSVSIALPFSECHINGVMQDT